MALPERDIKYYTNKMHIRKPIGEDRLQIVSSRDGSNELNSFDFPFQSNMSIGDPETSRTHTRHDEAGMTPIPSSSRLPHMRLIKNADSHRLRKGTTDSEILKLNINSMAPSIRKAIHERAQFYRRKLCFY